MDIIDILMAKKAVAADIGTPGSAVSTALNAAYIPIAGTTPGSVPVVKPSGDTRAGVWEFTHNAKAGYMHHLLAGTNFGGSAGILAIGHDNDDGTGIALLLAEKSSGKGLVIDQRSTKTGATSYGLHATNSSTTAPLVRLEQNVAGAADALQMIAGPASAGQVMARFSVNAGTAGVIFADTGQLMWKRGIEARDPASGTLGRITARNDDGVANPSPVHHDRLGIEFRTYAGSGTSYWPKRIFHNGTSLRIQGSATVTGIDTAPATWVDGLTFEFNTGTAKIGFFGASAVARQTVSTAATDAATTQTLVNDIRTALVNLGLVA